LKTRSRTRLKLYNYFRAIAFEVLSGKFGGSGQKFEVIISGIGRDSSFAERKFIMRLYQVRMRLMPFVRCFSGYFELL
jgi:hypothetical protein